VSIGLAIARELAQAGREVLILEAGEAYGRGVSSRSSEVVHAGLYYEPGTFAGKAVRRRQVAALRLPEQAQRRAQQLRQAHRRIVPRRTANAGEDHPDRCHERPVDDLELLDARQASALEPQLVASGAILSPSTGMMDSAGVMLALLGRGRKCRRVTGP
jgi:L-2-hydroxyglutarate oxidase LhgO